jgi:hypothetical protein
LLSTRVRAEVAEVLLASTALGGKHAHVLGWDSLEAALDLIRSSLA